jgi:alkanesulfonate monooxygenase SsuD/methylene tetrahydromethanopterin reductase-like flavin-dependent oxidoreductase (luciferase family)
VDGRLAVGWAAQAEQGPFASLDVIDRLAYDSYDPLIALAAAASVTERLRLATTILTAPLRPTVALAKQLASLHQLSGGRLVVGVGVGAREDDYELAGAPHRGRGRRLDDQLVEFISIFERDGVGLRTSVLGRPTLLAGGTSGRALARMARYTDGYIHGGGPPRVFARAVEEARAAWHDAGRPGTPQLWGQAYFAFGDGAAAGEEYLRHYYAFTGAFADKIAAGLLTSPSQLIEFVHAYEEAGCRHLCLLPAVADRSQLDALAECLAPVVVGGGR